MPNPIDTTTFPGDDIFPEAITAAAASIRSTGTDVATHSATVLTSWQRLSADYEAPESGTLLRAMEPVKSDGETFSTQLGSAATALETFATEASAIKKTLDGIRTEAKAFTASIKGGVDRVKIIAHGTAHESVPWDEDQASIDKNNALIAQVNAQQVLLWAAERKCANALHDLTGAAHVEAASGSNPNGYGVDEIPAGTDLPWGHKTDRTEHCGEKSAKAVWHFTADGIVGGVIGGAAQDIGGLFGAEFPHWDPRTWGWSAETAASAWKGMAMLGQALSPTSIVMALLPGGQSYRDNYKALWDGIKAPYTADKWHDHPAATAGELVGNLLLFAVGVGEVGAGVRAAGAASKAGRVAEEASAASKALSAGSKVAKATDPLFLATQAVKFAGKAGGLSVEALSKLFKGVDLTRGVDLDLPARELDFPDVDRDGLDPGQPVDHSHPGDEAPVRDLPADRHGDPATRTEHRDPADDGSPDRSRDTRPGASAPAHRYDPDAPVRPTTTQAEAPHGYRPEDVDAAREHAPVDAQGRPVDHRNGEPLAPDNPDGSRAWHMKWDPQAHEWVAENPGHGLTHPGDLPLTGSPDSFGYDSHGDLLPYANHRPSYTADQVREVWEAAKDADGEVWVMGPDGNPVRVEWEPGQPRQGVWDMGHQSDRPYRDLREDYLSHRISREEFLEAYHDPDNYRPEDPSRNRSHVDEVH